MLNNESNLNDTIVSTNKAHVTLTVFRSEDNELEKAKAVVREAYEEIKQELLKDPITLTFEGVRTFPGDTVIYAHPKLEKTDQTKLQKLMRHFIERLTENGFSIPERDKHKQIKPHITIMRIFGNCKMKTIPFATYKDLVRKKFGVEQLGDLQFLSMYKPPSSDGYYHIEEVYKL